MNLNPSAKRILFYGDSLVFGKKPALPQRFGVTERFTGIIQAGLGQEYEIVEEGLRARNLSGENNFFKERDGLAQFAPIFASHAPVDMVVIMLGTNDCNNHTNNKTAEEYEAALASYRQKMRDWCTFSAITEPKLLVVAPPHIRGEEVRKNEAMFKIFGEAAEEKSKKLRSIYERFCTENVLAFFDAAEVCEAASGEGVHLDVENNRKLGEALVGKIKAVL